MAEEKLEDLVRVTRQLLVQINQKIETKLSLDQTAAKAHQLDQARTISLLGDVAGSGVFDGTANLSITAVMPDTGVTAASYGASTSVPVLTIDAKGRVTNASTVAIRAGNLTQTGLVQLSNSVNSTSDSAAATPSAVKQAYDLAAGAIPATQKGVAGGVASLDQDGKVPAAQLPSYVDDVVEVVNFAGLPTTGESGKIYLTTADNKVWRWTGSTYLQINNSVGTSDTATRLATPRTINGVLFDGTQNITLETVNLSGNQTIAGVKTFTSVIDGDIDGNAGSANKWLNAMGLNISGDVTGSTVFDGSADAAVVLGLAATGVVGGIYGSDNEYPVLTIDSKGRVTNAASQSIRAASTTQTGLVRLSSDVNSTSTSLAATPAAVKSAYDLASTAIQSSQRGVAGGVATLGSDGKVPAAQLPSYVDDVIEADTEALFPTAGETGKIYVSKDNNKAFRWTGSSYLQINSSVGTADVAVKLASSRSISITGDATWSVAFDGSANTTGSLTLANTGVEAGTYGNADYIPQITVDSKGRVTSLTTVARPTTATTAARLTTARTISASGDITATGNFDGSTNLNLVTALSTTGVTAGSYPVVTVDAKGRVTAGRSLEAADIPAIPVSKVTSLQGLLDGKLGVSGVAAKATVWETARTIGVTGDATWSVTMDGSANATAALTLANSGATAGSYGTSIAVPVITVDAKGRVTAVSNTFIRTATTAQTGIVQLSSAVNSTSDVTAASSSAVKQAYDIANNAIPMPLIGVAGGVASLGADGKVPASQLPSYVDDVLEAASLAALPTTGESGKIYVTTNNNYIYRWTGSTYIQITGGTGTADAANKLATSRSISATGDATWTVSFDGSANVTAAMTLANSGVTAGTYPKVTVDAKGRVTAGAALAAGDIPANLTSSTSGNAGSATKLATARTISATGDATWSVSFDGSQNATAAITLASTGVAAGTYSKVTVDAKGRVTAGAALADADIPANLTSSTSGNAATATKLATARTINGVSFDGTANITIADSTKLPLSGGTISGSLGVTGGVTSSGDVTAFSDIRLKTNIEAIDRPLERIEMLKGVTFERKDDPTPGQRSTGLIAQDVLKALPEAVREGEHLSVAYGNLAGLFAEGIKVLNKQQQNLTGMLVDAIETIETLKQEVADLRARVA